MGPLRGGYRLTALSLVALFCTTTPLDAQPPSREQPRFGGVLKVAMPAEPPTLDPHWTNAFITSQIMRHVFETLYTFDKDWRPVPHLAAGHTMSDSGRVYTITLRKGVKFHSGKEMTSADVVASLNRWGRMSILGKALWKSVEAVDGKGPYEVVIHLKEGLMTGKKLRQTFQAALDMEPIMAAAAGHPLFWRVDPGLWPPELVLWHSTAGGAVYNQKDKDKARRLLKEAGYAGQPVRWLTTQEYDYMSKSALVAKQQLEEVGFRIDLQVLDWATLVQRMRKPELSEVFSNGWSFDGRDPTLSSIIQCTSSGWWCLEEKERRLGELAWEMDPRKRKALIHRIQVLFYEDVGRIKFGDLFTLAVVRKELRGDFRSFPLFYFWNAWLERK